MKTLEGMRVTLLVSDPWEFGVGPFEGCVLRQGRNDMEQAAILIRLDVPVDFAGIRCEYFVASARQQSDDIGQVAEGESVFCGLVCISEDRTRSANPLDTSCWRGGVAILASIGRCAEQAV